jgi:hypothetical protein
MEMEFAVRDSVGMRFLLGGSGGGTSNYDELTGKPQINGVTLAGNKTAAQLGLLDASTKYGAGIALSLDQTTRQLTATLKDQDGNVLAVSQPVTLPEQSAVVDGDFDDTTKEIVLILQNGSEIRIPVGDLVDGLQTEITSENKLAADLVDDSDSTHKFVTASEKTKISNAVEKTGDVHLSGVFEPNTNGGASLGSSNYRFADVYTQNFNGQDTTGKGLSSNDYTTAEQEKLSGIAAGAEVNQNAFSNVKVGTVTVAADTKTDTLTIAAGANVTITPDAASDKITIAAQDTTYSPATASTAGLMSAADKTALDALASEPDHAVVPNYTLVNFGSTWTSLEALHYEDGKLETTEKSFITPGLAAGAGLAMTSVSPTTWNTTYTIKADLKSETKSSLTAASKGSTASREYAVGLDANGDLAVNVPWVNTVSSVEAGAGISVTASGNVYTVGHSNEITEKKHGIYSISVDAQGHITQAQPITITYSGGGTAIGSAEINNAYSINFVRVPAFGELEVTGNGNAVTSISGNTSTGKITVTKGSTFLTQADSMKLVYRRFFGQYSGTASYRIATTDFTAIDNAQQCGMYLITIISWSATPTASIYIAYYSGGTTGYNALTKIGGADAQVAIDTNRNITYTGTGKIQIYALQ